MTGLVPVYAVAATSLDVLLQHEENAKKAGGVYVTLTERIEDPWTGIKFAHWWSETPSAIDREHAFEHDAARLLAEIRKDGSPT